MSGEYIMVSADGNRYNCRGGQRAYDAAHVAVGAILAGADTVLIERRTEDDSC